MTTRYLAVTLALALTASACATCPPVPDCPDRLVEIEPPPPVTVVVASPAEPVEVPALRIATVDPTDVGAVLEAVYLDMVDLLDALDEANLRILAAKTAESNRGQ
jgi:hypothetical protein